MKCTSPDVSFPRLILPAVTVPLLHFFCGPKRTLQHIITRISFQRITNTEHTRNKNKKERLACDFSTFLLCFVYHRNYTFNARESSRATLSSNDDAPHFCLRAEQRTATTPSDSCTVFTTAACVRAPQHYAFIIVVVPVLRPGVRVLLESLSKLAACQTHSPEASKGPPQNTTGERTLSFCCTAECVSVEQSFNNNVGRPRLKVFRCAYQG